MNFPEIATLVTDIHFNYFKIEKDFNQVIPIISSNEDDLTYYKYVKKAIEFKNLKNIEMSKLDYEETFILGRYQKYYDYEGIKDNNFAQIWIAYRKSNCWKRYLAAKELSHLIVDNNENSYTVNIHDTIVWMIQDNMAVGVNEALDSEHIAAQLAIELLLPYHSTQSLLKDKNVKDSVIANQFKVPLSIIEHIRGEKSKYLDIRDDAYKDTDIKHNVINTIS